LRWGCDDDIAVGTLAEAARGRVVFEYDDAFLATGLQISPWKLPAQPGLIEHTEREFGPLFGVFDDSLPDGWGLLLMDRYFRRQGRDPGAVSALERLLYIGSGAMGALTYHPATEPKAPVATIDLRALADEAERVLQGADVDVLPELRRLGGSPAGARPKVLVGVRGDEVVSGIDELPAGFEHWLVKFPSGPQAFDTGPLEYAYMRMAERAGIDVPAHRLFAGGRFFGVRRFDRDDDPGKGGNRRLHMHTLGGLVQSNYRVPSCDYDLLFRVARRLTADRRAVAEGVRRMVFNVAAHNRDDHVKNFAFLMDAQGEWTMSPAYDLSYARGPGGEHTMTIDGEGREPTYARIVELAVRHGLKRREVRDIVERVDEAVAQWLDIASDSGCDEAQAAAVARAHRLLSPR